MLTRLDSMLLFRIPWIHWSISVRFQIRFWTVDWLRRSQIGSRRQVRFWTLPWTVNLWRGLLTWSIRLWGCLWTMDSWRGCRVWSQWSSRFSICCGSHDLVEVSQRRPKIGSRWCIRFRTLPWTVDVWRGLLTWNIRFWGVSGQWTHGGDVKSGTIEAVGS